MKARRGPCPPGWHCNGRRVQVRKPVGTGAMARQAEAVRDAQWSRCPTLRLGEHFLEERHLLGGLGDRQMCTELGALLAKEKTCKGLRCRRMGTF